MPEDFWEIYPRIFFLNPEGFCPLALKFFREIGNPTKTAPLVSLFEDFLISLIIKVDKRLWLDRYGIFLFF